MDPLDAPSVARAAGPWPAVFVERVGSTMDLAATLGDVPAVVVADVQTDGRGRRGRAWDDAGGLATTFLVPAALPPHALPVVVATLVRRAVPTAKVKWPNDLLLDARKLGGILIERRGGGGGRDLIGVGLNVIDPRHPDRIGLPGERRLDVLARLCRAMTPLLDPPPDLFDRLLVEYRRYLAWVGCDVVLTTETTDHLGPFAGVDPLARALVDGRPHATGTLRLARSTARAAGA